LQNWAGRQESRRSGKRELHLSRKSKRSGLQRDLTSTTLPILFGAAPVVAVRRKHGVSANPGNRFIMAVKIRLKRIGAKNSPVYRVVVTDSRSPRDGKCIEEIGTYHPVQKTEKVTIDRERAEYWLSQGAKPSDTVASLLKKAAKKAEATAAA
jgi:small subunit ribosomal protein S16